MDQALYPTHIRKATGEYFDDANQTPNISVFNICTFAVCSGFSDLKDLSYSLGIILGERLQKDFGSLDSESILQGLQDSASPSRWRLSRPEINRAVQEPSSRRR